MGDGSLLKIIAESRKCDMTQMMDDQISDYLGNTFLPGSNDNDYIFISGLEFIKTSTEDKRIVFVSLMDNTMIPTVMAFGEKYTLFIYDHYNFLENLKTEECTLSNSTNDSLDPLIINLPNVVKMLLKR